MSENIVLTKFSDDLVFNFEKLAVRSDVSVQAVKDITESLKKRAEIESEYAKKLLTHCKTVPGSGMFTGKDLPVTKEAKSMKDALNAISEKGQQVAEQHQEAANKIINDVVKVLENWIKTKEADRKKILEDGKKLVKSLTENKANALKRKGDYEKLMKDTDTSKDALIKAEKDEIAQPDNKKLQAVTKKASEAFQGLQKKAKEAEGAYKTGVEKINEELSAFKSDKMPAVLQQFQTWEQDRWTALLNAVTAFKSIQEAIPTAFEKFVSDLKSVIDEAKLDSDLQEIVAACKINKEEEQPLEFVAFKSKHEDVEPVKPKEEAKPAEKKEEEKPAEEKEEEKKEEKKPEPAKETPEQAAEKKKKEEDNKKKAEAAKQTLFGGKEDDSDDIFK